MIAIAFRFCGGRYHATPWGRHVNEGVLEWPPAPWRILRSLIACYHRKAWQLPEPLVRTVIEKLTSLPSFRLPPASPGHTRHYMPQRDPLGSDKTKILDSFVAVGGPLVAMWPTAELDGSERDVLQGLLDRISYLGRAESWVEASLLPGDPGEPNCWPAATGLPAGWERVSLLAAMEPDDYLAWAKRLPAVETKAPRGKGAGLAGPAVPPDIWAALHAESGELQRQGWPSPPGSRLVDYARPAGAFQVEYCPVRPGQQQSLPTVARFALAGDVLPLLTEAVALGERMRQAAMAHTRGVAESAETLALFSGRASDGRPRDDNHAHAFYLPADDDGDGRIDHLTVYVPAGLPPAAQKVLGRLKKLWGQGGHDVYLALVGLGNAADYGGFNVMGGQTPQLATSRVWVSKTPYMLTRHPKTYRDGRPKVGEDGLQVDSPESQLRNELARRGLPSPVNVEPVQHIEVRGKRVRWLEFRRERLTGGGRLASPAGYGFRVTFPQPVTGPVALGYGCHYGLGQFIAERDHGK